MDKFKYIAPLLTALTVTLFLTACENSGNNDQRSQSLKTPNMPIEEVQLGESDNSEKPMILSARISYQNNLALIDWDFIQSASYYQLNVDDGDNFKILEVVNSDAELNYSFEVLEGEAYSAQITAFSDSGSELVKSSFIEIKKPEQAPVVYSEEAP